MATDLLILILGAFIGWNMPQPLWAQHAQAWAKGKVADFFEEIR